MTRPDLAAHDILAALNRHGVDYVVIGAFAQRAPLAATADIDVTPSRDPENLARLSAALDELGAGIRVDDVDEGLPFRHDKRSLAAVDMLSLTCPAGDFDLVRAEGSPVAGPVAQLTGTRSGPVTQPSGTLRRCPRPRASRR